MSQSDKLLRMAEQIALNLGAAADPVAAGERTAAHLRRFWTPQMMTELLQHAQAREMPCSPALQAALGILAAKTPA